MLKFDKYSTRQKKPTIEHGIETYCSVQTYAQYVMSSYCRCGWRFSTGHTLA